VFDPKRLIAQTDPQLWSAMQQELQRQEDHIELIASENYASPAVLQAQGSVLTNKYAEGYPGRRYYGGCEFVDKIESLAIERASLPSCLEVTAESDDGEIMGVRHRNAAVEGVQFHPEAILTEQGHELLANFLRY